MRADQGPDPVVVQGICDLNVPGEPLLGGMPAGDAGVSATTDIKRDAVTRAQHLEDLLFTRSRPRTSNDRSQGAEARGRVAAPRSLRCGPAIPATREG